VFIVSFVFFALVVMRDAAVISPDSY